MSLLAERYVSNKSPRRIDRKRSKSQKVKTLVLHLEKSDNGFKIIDLTYNCLDKPCLVVEVNNSKMLTNEYFFAEIIRKLKLYCRKVNCDKISIRGYEDLIWKGKLN